MYICDMQMQKNSFVHSGHAEAKNNVKCAVLTRFHVSIYLYTEQIYMK